MVDKNQISEEEKREGNAVKEKSFAFAVRCVKLYTYLKVQKREYDLSRQLLRSGTSIGANVREGLYAQSRADFLSKMSIAKKEAAESEYWLELLLAVGVLNEKEAGSMLEHCRELIKILVTTCKTTKHGKSVGDKSDDELENDVFDDDGNDDNEFG